MQIVSLHLKGYLRLMLNNIKEIHYEPQEKIQVIVGTNGSGKSSLIKELSPLPAVNKEFIKGGYKEIVLIHNKSKYVLRSEFISTQRHSFIKDDEELNPSGILTIQRELVKQHFNITKEIHNILTSRRLFHEMGSEERREWFINLSENDYSFAISQYQRLKKESRDIEGAINRTQTRLVNEVSKLVTEDEYKLLNEEVLYLKNLLEKLIELKSPLSSLESYSPQRALQIEKEIKELSVQILRYRTKIDNSSGFTDEECIDSEVISETIKQTSIEKDIEYISSEIESRQKLIQTLKESSIASYIEIDDKLISLAKNKDTLLTQLKLPIVFTDPALSQKSFEVVKDSLLDIIQTIPVNESKLFTRVFYQELIDKINSLKTRQESLETTLFKAAKFKENLIHLKNHDPIECPSCRHKWIKDYSEADYQKVLSDIDKLNKAIESIEIELKTLTDKKDTLSEYFQCFSRYTHLTEQFSILTPFWEYLLEKQYLFKDPNYIKIVIMDLENDFKVHKEILENSNETSRLKLLKESITENKETDLSQLEKETDIKQNRLYEMNLSLNKVKTRIKCLQQTISTIKSINQTAYQLRVLISNHDELTNLSMQSHRRDEINAMIKNTHLELSIREDTLKQMTNQKRIVTDLENEIKTLKEQSVVYSLMVEGLSPTDGLIAKGLTGFMNNFIKQMNGFIKKIWSYPLEILPFEIDADSGDELDYKFRVRVNSDDIITTDVSETSSAMREIINLAFVVVSAQYLKLHTASAFLDEIGRAMDSMHRAQMFRIIADMFSMSEYSQVFVISHFEDCYGCFSNTDMVVLCPKNVVIPENARVNEYVKIS